MVVTVHYEDGVEVFDTAERVDPATARGNALSNWALRLEDAREGDALGGKRLWLRHYEHALPPDGDAGADPAGLPVAARRDVASFLVADAGDVERVLKVTVDGADALVRMGGELVNASRFARAADVACVYGPQAAAVRRHLERAMGEDAEGDPEEAICAAMGFSPESFARAAHAADPDGWS